MPPAPRLEMAYCGLDCSGCDEYRATRAGDRAALEAAMAKWGHKSPAGTLCDGCLGGGRLSDSCSACAVRLCASMRGHATCAACPDYACATLAPLLARTPEARAALERLRGA